MTNFEKWKLSLTIEDMINSFSLGICYKCPADNVCNKQSAHTRTDCSITLREWATRGSEEFMTCYKCCSSNSNIEYEGSVTLMCPFKPVKVVIEGKETEDYMWCKGMSFRDKEVTKC